MIAEREAQGQAKLIAELLSAGVSPETKLWVERWALDKGIPLDKQPPR